MAALIKALDDISLSIAPGEWVAMMGPSGSGKSTMVNLIGCLDRPTSGEIWLDGQNVASLSASDLNHVRAETIGFVFQQFHMIPYLTARRERHAGAILPQHDRRERSARSSRSRRPQRSRRPPAFAAFRRRAAARLHRARSHQRSQDRAGRRAHRQSRCSQRRNRPAPACANFTSRDAPSSW